MQGARVHLARPSFLLAVLTVLAALAVLLVTAGSASAAIFSVTTTADPAPDGSCPATECSLREAILAANANGAGLDRVDLPAGTFRLARTGTSENDGRTGDLDVLGDLELVGAGARSTVVDADELDRVLDVPPLVYEGDVPTNGPQTGTDVTIRGLTLTGGAAPRSEGNPLDIADFGFGGGLRTTGTTTMTDAAVSGNESAFDAGGIRNDGSLSLERVQVTDNATGEFGGGVLNNATARLTNVTVSGNSAGTTGGGLVGFASSVEKPTEVRSSTIAGNSAPTAANIANPRLILLDTEQVTEAGSLTLRNTLVAEPLGGGENCERLAVTSRGGNLEFPGTSCGMTAPGDRRANPLLAALADNGGPTDTRALAAGSPAVDAALAEDLPGVDQRGVRRPQRGDRGDIGAFELEPSPPTSPPPPAPSVPPATTTTVPSTSPPPTARTCRSRRAFTIRLRPGHRAVRLVSATVRVAGRRVAVRRRGRRLIATVDLRRRPPASFAVQVVARDSRGRAFRETRVYRTCRIGPNGRPVPLGRGSTILMG